MRLGVVAILLVCLPCASAGQQRESRLRVDVRLVLMNTVVNDSNGRPVSDLPQERFRVFEDGREQPLAVFASGDAPVHVVLVLDTSGSTRKYLDQLKLAARFFVEHFGPQDYLALYDLGPNAVRVTPFTTNHEQVVRAIDRLLTTRDTDSSQRKAVPANALVVGGENATTVLYDGLAAIEREFPPEAQRRAIIAFTDSFDEGSTMKLEEVSQRLLRGSATLYAVMPLRSDIPELAREAVVGSKYKSSTGRREQLSLPKPPDWVIQWAPSASNSEIIAHLSEISDIRDMVSRAMEEQGTRSGTLYLAELPETNEPVWMIQLDETSGDPETISRVRECAARLLRLLPSDARVWLMRYREKRARLLQPALGPSVRANPPQPLTREEAQKALNQPDTQDPVQGERGKRFLLRADRVLILTDAHRSGVRELLGGRPPAWFAQNIVVPEVFPSQQTLDATLAVVVKSASEYLKLQFDAAERRLRETRSGFEELVQNTGGLVLEFRRPRDLRDSYEQIAREIKASYALGYYTRAGYGSHQLRVEVTAPQLIVRSRRVLVIEE